MKKIAYCTPSLYIPGGVERVLTTKANYLAEKAGYEVYIILTDGKGKDPYYALSPKVRLIQLDLNFEELWHRPFWKKILLYLKKQRRYKKALTETLLNIRPDITVSLLRREINFITTIKDGSKKIGELHVNRLNYRNFEQDETNFIKEWFSKYWMKSLVKKLKHLDKFIVLSQEDKLNWPELKNVEVISNPLSFETDRCSELTSHNVIAVGRYTYQKGFDLLIQAWNLVYQKHPDWQLFIYGKGEKTEYQELIHQLSLENCCHTEDAVPHIIDKYCKSSIFVLSSRFEGFGLVLTEAMQCGLPCVSFACPCGPKDIITPGENGYLAENGKIEELAEKILLLIEDEPKRIKMGKNAKASSRQYSEENIMKQWIRLFENL